MIVLVVMLCCWSVNLLVMVYVARRNRWAPPWKTMVILSVFVGPFAVLLWRVKQLCGPTQKVNAKDAGWAEC